MVPPITEPPKKPRGLRAYVKERVQNLTEIFKQLPATFRLVWEADRRGLIVVMALTGIAALLPAAMAWVGKLIVDAVVHAAKTGADADKRYVLELVGLELGLMIVSTFVTRLSGLMRELLRANLGNVINTRIIEKALKLELRHFEDSATYDKMQNARREASSRPLSLVMQGLNIIQNGITLVAYAAILVRLSPWSVLVLALAAIPAFIAEAKLAGESFRLYTWRAPEGRKLNYLEWILTRDSHVKEVKLFGLGGLILGRYRKLFSKFYDEDKRLAYRRLGWGLGLGLLSLATFYACYALVATRAASSQISLGDMALYLAVFRQGQGAFQTILSGIGSMYEDSLFMSNLFVYFAIPVGGETPRLLNPKSPPRATANRIELKNVTFRYPGKDKDAIRNLTLTLEPGEKLALVGENGAGKSTIVKLLLRLYDPTEGEILYGGVDLRDIDVNDLRSRFGAVFQDFVRYQFSAGENIGLGHVPFLDETPKVQRAAEQGGAATVIDTLPKKYETMLGGWFEAGQELSAGQWQKLAVSRAFMRDDAEVLILDEPTASIDAEAEHELFKRFQTLAEKRTGIIISHRFSTVRIADRIAVINDARLEEIGSHDELMKKNGRYARLFELQARGYR